MISKARSIGIIMVLLCILTVLLAACGDSTSAATSTLRASPTTVPTSSVAGDFVEVVNSVDFIGLSSNGQQLIAYICDGTQTHSITFAHWFKGQVTNNTVNLTADNGAHLVATLTVQAAMGTITLKDGKSFSFTAKAITDPNSQAGLYRSEKTVGGVPYLAGWVLVPSPSALSTLVAFLGGPFAPLYVKGGGGIINKQTGALLLAPALTPADISARQVMVPNLGTFALTLCRRAMCS